MPVWMSGQEGQRRRQRGLVEPVAQRRRDDTGQDAAEYAHLQGLDAQNAGDCALLDVRGDDAVHDGAVQIQTDAHGGQHDDVEHARGKHRDALLLPGHAEGDRQGEDQGQVPEDRVARPSQHLHDAVEKGARMQDVRQAVGGDGGGVGEGAADAEQDARRRKDRDGKEQGFADLLCDGKSAAILFFCHGYLLCTQTPSRPAGPTLPGNRSDAPGVYGMIFFFLILRKTGP